MALQYFHIDFETRSPQDLEDVGMDVYTSDPDADVWCMACALDDEEPSLFNLTDTLDIRLLLADPDIRFVAHNAPFEMAVWANIMQPKYGWPELDPARIDCTMVQGYAMGLPGSLDKMSAALGIAVGKALAGSRLAVQMSRPRANNRCDNCFNSGCVYCGDMGGGIVWWNEPEKLARLYEYCKQDVRVEREVHRRIYPLPPQERRLWAVDHEINTTGVYLDLPAIDAAISIVNQEQGRMSAELADLTAGAVMAPSQVTALTDWMHSRNVHVESLQKTDIIEVLARPDLPEDVRRAAEIRQEYARTSTAKLAKMRDGCSPDGRLRHILQFGAAATGRWGGRRMQPQNMPRPKMKQKEIEMILEFLPRMTTEQAIERLDLLHGRPIACISDCLRGMITAPLGHKLCAGDFSNIEGRTLAWLADEKWKVQAFRDFDLGIGPDLYLLAAARIYHRPHTEYTKESPERQIGKVAELACGYQGGVGAFQTMAYTYGVRVADAEADAIKTAWREANPNIVNYWYALERAAYDAVAHPGMQAYAGPPHRGVRFKVQGSFLFCLLPSGRALCYPYPKLKMKMTPWGEEKEQVHYKTVDDRTKQWVETSTYGGKLAENITQAVSRDILAYAIMTVHHEWDGKIVLHVHDEIVGETVRGTLEKFLTCMRKQPEWSAGLPISVDGWEGTRYRK